MPKRALAQRRPYLMLSLLAGFVYYYLQASSLPEFYIWPVKGAACAFLAFYAWLRHSSWDAKQVAAAMAVASVADMAIHFDLRVGAAIFVIFHVIMIRLFMRNNRGAMEGSDNLIFLAILILPPLIGYAMPADSMMKWLVAVYAVFLSIMAASAWASTFPRWKVAAGAVLFVISDLVIFAGLGPLSGVEMPGIEIPVNELLVWPIYYLGQFLLTVGVITTLRKRDPELTVVQGGIQGGVQ